MQYIFESLRKIYFVISLLRVHAEITFKKEVLNKTLSFILPLHKISTFRIRKYASASQDICRKLASKYITV